MSTSTPVAGEGSGSGGSGQREWLDYPGFVEEWETKQEGIALYKLSGLLLWRCTETWKSGKVTSKNKEKAIAVWKQQCGN